MLSYIKSSSALAAALISVLCANAAAAAEPDPELGEYLSSQCVTCHKMSVETKGIPSLIGWDADSFIAVLNSYKSKERENKVMQTIAASLSADDIAALAAYYATLKAK